MGKFVKELRDAIVIDYETMPIRPRPEYPPRPVGVAIQYPGNKARYYVGDEMVSASRRAFSSGAPLLFHNARFDIDVATTHLGCVMPAPERIHDTLIMLFLRDPHAETFSLKPSAEKILGMKPEERDEVIDWLVKYQPVPGVKLSDKPKSDNYAGAYICKAPEEIVSKYAIGDVERTRKLALKVGAEIEERDMLDAYQREQQLMPVVLGMEKHGVRVDVAALKRDKTNYDVALKRVDNWLKKKLKVKEINLDSNKELAEALINAKLASKEAMGLTPTGMLCTAMAALEAAITDKQVSALLRWRGAVNTCLNTFIMPWYEQSKKTGRVFAEWNAVRKDHAAGGGTRTGRLSSSPNLQNIPKAFKPLFSCWEPDLKKAKKLPKCPLNGLLDVPRVRSYILPDKRHVLIDRDFSSQELRVLAYFEDDTIAQAFIDKPNLDLHQRVADDLHIDRQQAKTVNFAILYGVGNGHLAEMLNVDVGRAKEIKMAYFDAYPSVKELIAGLKDRAKSDLPIRTWGGREYFVEPPRLINNRLVDFSYKLLNYLIQGSSADLTKQTMIEFHQAMGGKAHILASVHDELLVSVPKEYQANAMTTLRDIMAKNRLGDVPMLSTGKVGYTWATMKGCE